MWLTAFKWDEMVDALINAKDFASSAVVEKRGKASREGEDMARGAKISVACLINSALQEAARMKGGAAAGSGLGAEGEVDEKGRRQTTMAGFFSQEPRGVRLSHSDD